MKEKYKLTIYFIGGTTLTTEYERKEDIEEVQKMLENSKMLKKFNNYIRLGSDGINVKNINCYQIKKLEEDKS